MTKLTKKDLAEIAAKRKRIQAEIDEHMTAFENASKNQSRQRREGMGNIPTSGNYGKRTTGAKTRYSASMPATPGVLRREWARRSAS